MRAMCGCIKNASRARILRISEVFPWAQIPKAHTRMWKNQHAPGNMAVLVNAPCTGLRTFDDVIEAGKGVA